MVKKTVWICFGIALVLVNLIAEVGEYFTGVHIHMILRVSLIFGITMGVTVLAGTFQLINNLERERPLSGKARDTLGPDRKKN